MTFTEIFGFFLCTSIAVAFHLIVRGSSMARRQHAADKGEIA